MEIQRLESSAWQRFKLIRITSLGDSPDAFGSTLAVAEQRSEQEWRQQLKDAATFVATEDGEDFGLVRGIADNEVHTQAFLISMWVAPNTRQFGIGKSLVQAVVDWAQAAGFQRLLLDVADTNTAAIKLYESMHFQPTGETGTLPAPRTHVREHRRARDLQVSPR